MLFRIEIWKGICYHGTDKKRINSGGPPQELSAALADMEIVSPAGEAAWSLETISKILANEKYVGDVILGKTQAVDGVQVKSSDARSQVHMCSAKTAPNESSRLTHFTP